MNSHVSVEEQEEVSLDEFDSFIFSASNINQGGVDSDRSEKDTIFFNNEYFSASGVTIEPVLSDDLSLNTINEYENTGQLNSTISKRTRKRSRKKGASNVQSKPSFTHFCDKNPVNSTSIPLETPFMNLPDRCTHSSSEIPIEVDWGKKLFSDSDNSNDSFNGFSDLSNTSFEGFLNKSTESGYPNSSQLTSPFESIEKTNRLRSGSVIREISNSFGKYQVKCSSKTDRNSSSLFINPDSSASFSKSLQNYFESPSTPFHSSTSEKFKKETDASRRMYKESKKEDLKSPEHEIRKRKDGSLKQNSLDLNSTLGTLAFNDDSDTESFEGFSVRNEDKINKLEQISSNLLSQTIDETNQSNIPFETLNEDFPEENDLGTMSDDLGENENVETTSDDFGENENDLETMSDYPGENENDFIGDHCNRIGCTISWLETGMGKANPVQITNGIVYELSEFAKKIAWEPTYIAIWILRLRTYINIEVGNDDMKKINSVIKRRKALSVTFAGYANLKAKLKSFDSELFSLPSAERLVKEKYKFANNTSKNNSLRENNRSLPNNSSNTKTKEFKRKVSLSTINPIHKKTNDVKLSENDENLLDNSDSDLIFSDDEFNSYYKEFNNPENERASLYDQSYSSSSPFEKENIKDKSVYLENKDFSNKSSKGRIRKPTVKAQELYSLKSGYDTGDSSNDESALNKNLNRQKNSREKLLHPVFVENGKEIGPHCKANGIDIKLLNSFHETNIKITNGVVYELYQFFRERKASLTALVHTLYRLRNVSIDKSNIIPTMAKMHGMVKVLWDENILKNPHMPYDEFNFPQSCISKRSNLEIEPLSNQDNLSKVEKSENIRLKSKKLRLENENKILNSSPAPMDTESYSANSDTSPSQPNHSESKETGPMSNTFGYEGKITRGDIVYLYTKWLKKKMESQTNVFVTDLSKDVEALITSRKVDFIRIPVGTLMSSSVKLFEEFRKLSKSSMQEAKAYLLEDWIDDIKSILSSILKNSNTNDDKEVLKPKMQPKVVSKDKDHNNRANEQHIAIAYKDVSLPESSEANESTHCPSENEKHSLLTNKFNQIQMSEPIIEDLDSAHKMEKIVGYRIVKTGEENVTEYRLRWVGLPSSQDSWVNEDELDCADILAEFWDALIKQRASRGGPLPNIRKEFMLKPPLEAQNKLIPPENVLQEEKNLLPFFGIDKSSSKFFDLMVKSLQINLVDSQHEEEKLFIRRVKVTKGEILNLYNTWRYNNQKRLLAGSNQKLDVCALIDKVKSLMEEKRVRNFNPSCLLDLCYRMSLMQAKLEDPKKVQEYLSEDFMELLQDGQKHQDAVRRENELCLKQIKYNIAISTENQKLIEKINCLSNLERESLIIARFMQKNKFKSNLVKELQGEIDVMRKILDVKPIESSSIENLKKQNPNTIKELESLGVKEDVLDKILNIALKIE